MQDMSCAIKYKKMGFRAINPKWDEKIEQAIANGETGHQYKKSAFGDGYQDKLSCTMELTDEARKKYLGLDVIV